MGTIKGGEEWSGLAINGFDTDGAIKNGNIFWETIRYFMGILNTVPATGAELKILLEAQPLTKIEDKYILTSNGVDTNVIIAIPYDKTLIQVISSLAETLYLNTTPSSDNNFKLSSNITTIPKDGIDKDYKVYIMTTALPFSSNVTFNITVI